MSSPESEENIDPRVPDLSDQARKEDYRWDKLSGYTKSALEDYSRTEIEKLQHWEEYQSKRQKRQQRKEYADRIYQLIVWWLMGIGGVLLLQGLSGEFHLGENVLLALIGGTTANIVGIFYVVVRFLFPVQ